MISFNESKCLKIFRDIVMWTSGLREISSLKKREHEKEKKNIPVSDHFHFLSKLNTLYYHIVKQIIQFWQNVFPSFCSEYII